MYWVAMEEATEGIHDLTSSVSWPLRSFIDSLNASTEEVKLLLSNSREWIDELETGMLLRLDAFDITYRRANKTFTQTVLHIDRKRLSKIAGVLIMLNDKHNRACLPSCLRLSCRRFFVGKSFAREQRSFLGAGCRV